MASTLPRDSLADANILQIADALILYDTPMLDRRFQEAIARHPDAATREALAGLPRLVARGSRLTRRAAIEWERVTRGGLVDEPFVRRAEHILLEAFLDSAEAQIRLKSFMSRHAPTRETRDLVDQAIAIHRELVDGLREAIYRLHPREDDEPAPAGERASYLGREPKEGNLRGCVEAAIRRMRAERKQPKLLVLSHTALRHLRDEGLFQDGETSVMGVPVEVDLAWEASKFSLLSFESIPLDEIVRQGAAGAAREG